MAIQRTTSTEKNSIVDGHRRVASDRLSNQLEFSVKEESPEASLRKALFWRLAEERIRYNAEPDDDPDDFETGS
jgi:hypothetical protein